jgi:DNA polymerase-1
MADFDQIEQRMMAHFAWVIAGDPGLVHAFAEGGDFFTTMARRIYDDATIEKKDPRRQMTKNAAYAKGYGAGPAKFAITAGVDVASAAAFLDRYDAMYPGVVAFQRAVEQIATDRFQTEGDAYVKAPIGRIHIAERGKLYTLVNYLIQGAAADVLKMKMLELQQAGLEEFMVLPVHDEVLFDVPHEQVRDVMRTIEAVMPDNTFTVPLTVGVEHHARWGDKYAGIQPPELQ